MKPESRALAMQWAREGLTRNQIKLLMWNLLELPLDQLRLSDTSYKRTLHELTKAGLIVSENGRFRVRDDVRGVFALDASGSVAESATAAAKPTTVTNAATPKTAAESFASRPQNQQQWARIACKSVGFDDTPESLEAVAARKFGPPASA